LRSTPSPQSFHPSEAEVLIDLDSDAEAFRITIKSTPAITSIVGTWTAASIATGDIFVGDWHRAERIDPGTRVSEGDVIYLVSHSSGEPTLPGAKLHSLGRHRILATELTKEVLRTVRGTIPALDASPSMFQVDVVLPASADPRGLDPVEGVPDTIALVSIIPPAELDPGFEVVSVPFDADRAMELPRLGKGVPRTYRPSFPHRGSRRISIHWGDRHKLLLLHAKPEQAEPNQVPWTHEKPLGVQVTSSDGDKHVLLPWSQSTAYDVGMSHAHPQPRVELLGPPSISVEVQGTSPRRRGKPAVVVEPRVFAGELPQLVSDWIDQGYSEIEIRFGPTGRVLLTLFEARRKRPDQQRLSDEEIERRIGQLIPPIPEKPTWELICGIFEVEPKLSYRHHSMRGIMSRKQLRRVLKRMRAQDAS